MAAPTNYTGATIFWLYILAALLLTALVIHTLYTLPLAHPLPATRKPHLRRFILLSALSFAVLSFNMLHVLLQSFQQWSRHSFSQGPETLLARVWKWSVSSTLFLDFGEAIVAWESDGRGFWVLGALLATAETALFMGFEGTRRRVPRLWAFFGLAQILPVSFTVNLFYVALLLLPTDEGEEGARQASEEAPPFRLTEASWHVVLGYSACILAAPLTAETPWLLPLILTARSLLFVPLSLARNGISGWGSSRWFQLLLITVVGIRYSHFPGTTLEFTIDVASALFVHPAVSSLGCDWILYLISAGFWEQAEKTLGTGRESETKTQS